MNRIESKESNRIENQSANQSESSIAESNGGGNPE